MTQGFLRSLKARSRAGTQLLALCVAFGPAFNSTMSATAASTPDIAFEITADVTPSRSNFQVVDSDGQVEPYDLNEVRAALKSAKFSQTELNSIRQTFLAHTKSADRKAAARANRILLFIDILMTDTPAERHEAIRRLPVTIVRGPSLDGRAGTVKSFVADGKVRARLFVPAAIPIPESNDGDELLSEPAVSEECYEGAEEPCLTEVEMEDFGIYTAASEAEAAAQQAEFDVAYAELIAFCNNYPWMCEEGQGSLIAPSGPSAQGEWWACGAQVANAIGNLLVTSGVSWQAGVSFRSAAAVGLRVGAAVAGGWYLVVGGAIILSGVAIYQYHQCKSQVIPPQLP